MIFLGNIYAGLGGSTPMAITLNNGLTLTGTNGQLGGALVQGTQIDTTPGFSFFVGDNSNSQAFLFLNPAVFQSTWGTSTPDGSKSVQSLQDASVPQLTSQVVSSGATMSMTFNGDSSLGSMIVTDGIHSKGLEYAADYSANFTTNSLITKLYADSKSGTQFVQTPIKVTGIMSTQVLTSYLNAGITDYVYRISYAFNITAGTGTAGIIVTYTTQDGTVQTFTSPTIAANASNQAPLVIDVKQSTSFGINASITGTAIADFYVGIEFLF